jgi:hypothetical protein
MIAQEGFNIFLVYNYSCVLDLRKQIMLATPPFIQIFIYYVQQNTIKIHDLFGDLGVGQDI